MRLKAVGAPPPRMNCRFKTEAPPHVACPDSIPERRGHAAARPFMVARVGVRSGDRHGSPLPRASRPCAGGAARGDAAVCAAGGCRVGAGRRVAGAAAIPGRGRSRSEHAGALAALPDGRRPVAIGRRIAGVHRPLRRRRQLRDPARRVRPQPGERRRALRGQARQRGPASLRREGPAHLRLRLAAGAQGLGQRHRDAHAPAHACHRSGPAGAQAGQRAVAGRHPDSGRAQPPARPLWPAGRRVRAGCPRRQAVRRARSAARTGGLPRALPDRRGFGPRRTP